MSTGPGEAPTPETTSNRATLIAVALVVLALLAVTYFAFFAGREEARDQTIALEAPRRESSPPAAPGGP